ncbi:MAG: FAD-dependent oxidoreductase, partial [Candidatus Thermoplasmatota archaeon]
MKEEKYKRTKIGKLEPEERKKNFNEVVLGYNEDEAIEEAKRCIQCKKPLCVEACPIKQDIPNYCKLLGEGNFDDALEVIIKSNPIPGICGRICVKFCETKCILGKKGEPIAIAWLKRAAADFGKAEVKIEKYNGRKIAIIGSGPAGLSCAYFLAREGYDVKIFEKASRAGGMLSTVIPEYRLPIKVVEKEIEFLKKLGIKIETNKKISDISSLLSTNDALFIC